STELNIVDLNGVAETTNDISVYPNPAHKEINITCGEKINSIEVVDLLGKVVYQGKETTIDVSAFAKGNYFVRVQTEKGTITKKVIVE
ncbi:MAG: T9SS type A sorting domain-containing protein, partial [Bacteroidales bacterium]|nr:T9SS type A sorting domain-containing protein [Bacteroidales bacterium]